MLFETLIVPEVVLPRPSLRPLLALLLLAIAGCTSVETFPLAPVETRSENGGEILGYDLTGDGAADYEERTDRSGRIVALKAADWEADLDAADPAACPHLILVLDGVPFDLAREAFEQGDLRLFHPPQRLVGVFPSMTDLSLATIFGADAPDGIQSTYYCRERNEIAGGATNYLEKGNKTGFAYTDYHTGTMDSILLYLFPEWTLGREIDSFVEDFRESSDPVFVAYFGATAGIGTVDGEAGMRRYLARFGRLARQLVMEHRGRLGITILADHGHTLTTPKPAGLADFLKERGVRLTGRIEDDDDVVFPRLGLITVAAFATRRPERLAEVLLNHPGVDLCLYREGEAVAVRSRDATALVFEKGGRYRYDDSNGDPLGIAAAVGRCPADPEGYRDGRALLLATAEHEYPDALHRVWKGFHGLVKNTPDLLVSLKDDVVSGGGTWSFFMGDIASTHGSLNRMNSTTFILSTACEFPEPLRLEDVRGALQRIMGREIDPARR